jgi:hypothetical protein
MLKKYCSLYLIRLYKTFTNIYNKWIFINYTFVSPASESRRPVTLIWVKHQKEDYTYIDFVRMNIRVSIYFL